MIHVRGFWAATSARENSGENGLIRSRSRTCLALLPIVLLATPNASPSSSAVTDGSLAVFEHGVRLAQRIHHPVAHVARQPAVSGGRRLRASFATARGQIGVLLIEDSPAHRVGDGHDLISDQSQRFRHPQFVKIDHGSPGARCSPQPSAVAALRAAFLAAAGRAHFSADVTTWGLSRANLMR